MNSQNINSLIIVAVILSIMYTYLIFELGDSFLRNARLKKYYRIPLGILNTIMLFGASMVPFFNVSNTYVSFFTLILFEFLFLYKDKTIRIIMLVASFLLNAMAVRAIFIAVFSLVTGVSINLLVQDTPLFLSSFVATMICLNVMLCVAKIAISPELSKAVTEHTEQLIFITSWAGVASLYFVFINSRIYIEELPVEYVVQNQIAIALTLLIGYYIVLVFSILVGETARIKQKNVELSTAIVHQQQFRESIIHDALSVYELNLTQDLVIKGFEQIIDQLKKYDFKYSLLLKLISSTYVYPDDVSMFIKHASIEHLMNEYNKGKKETELVYRRRNPDGTHLWVKAIAHLYKDKTTGDIKAFVYIKDHHNEKLQELTLKIKAERDSLTTLYNKGTTEVLISEFLAAQVDRPHKGALLIIDVDNFKMVNDYLGHSYGDTVLHDLSQRLKTIFRCSTELDSIDGREDIIGRVGGDEFMIFVKNTSDVKLLSSKAEIICKAFSNTYQYKNMTVEISCSIGIALFPEDGISFESLYKSADVALYISKRKGKNTYSFYNGEQFEGYESKRGEIESSGIL